MFIKRNVQKTSGGKKITSYYLVKSYRNASGKTKHQYISNITALPEHARLALKASLSGQGEIPTTTTEDLKIICTKESGSISVFSKLYDQYFGKYFDHSAYNNALKAISINKIFNPKSKNGLSNWLKDVDLDYQISNKNDLYDCLDYLETQQNQIEERLSKKHKGKSNNILLYDVTSTYFEGKGAEDICKYGYSRDHRKDRVQVNIGLITSCDGTPISVEVIAGNISDKETLVGQVDKIKERFDIENLTFVFDRGMKSKVNLDHLQSQGYSYITALSHQELHKKAEQNKGIQQGLFDKRELSTFEIKGKYYSLVHSPFKYERDSKARLKLIEKTEARLKEIQEFKRTYTEAQIQDKVSKCINKYKCEKYLSYTISGSKKASLKYERNIEKIENDQQYDGFYMVESSTKEITGQGAVDQYKDLQLVERAFDSVKNHIDIRPIFHYKESRIKGHIFSCFISYFLLHKFKEKVQDLLKENTLDALLSQLQRVRKVYCELKGTCFKKFTQFSELQSAIFSRFKISVVPT